MFTNFCVGCLYFDTSQENGLLVLSKTLFVIASNLLIVNELLIQYLVNLETYIVIVLIYISKDPKVITLCSTLSLIFVAISRIFYLFK